jgi:two-component system CheB/CheR fusion protein
MTDTKPRNSNQKIVQQEDRITALKKVIVFYKEITETVREPFVILDKKLCVVTANRAFYRKFKVRKKDTDGRLIYELGNNQWDSLELRELLEHILPKHRVLNNYAVTHDFPSLGSKTMLLNARQVDSKQLILLAIEDVTLQWKLKVDSDELTKNLTRQRDRLQSLSAVKDEFIALASHQLRTPATITKQYVGMLQGGYAGKMSKNQNDMLNVAYNSNERQLEIVEDLLRVAQVDAGKVYLEKAACDVTTEAEAVIASLAVLVKSRGQRVVLHKPKRQVLAFMDQKLMRMVLENLLDNAGKYSRAGTRVTITIGQDNHRTTVSIEDEGVGIRKVDQQKLFKKFSRVDNPLSMAVKGTGLGLYWAKQILDLHDGSITVASRPDQGSTFTIEIPIET